MKISRYLALTIASITAIVSVLAAGCEQARATTRAGTVAALKIKTSPPINHQSASVQVSAQRVAVEPQRAVAKEPSAVSVASKYPPLTLPGFRGYSAPHYIPPDLLRNTLTAGGTRALEQPISLKNLIGNRALGKCLAPRV